MLLNWLEDVLGPLVTDHTPVPDVGVLAASVTLVDGKHNPWLLPALDTVGASFTAMLTFDEDAVHGELLIVQVNT